MSKAIPLDLSQKSFCELEGNAIRLLAPAGSGKTHSLLWRCKRLVHDNPNARILLFAFTRAARDEITARLGLSEFAAVQSHVLASTLNSFGYQIVLRAMPDSRLVLSKKEQFMCMIHMLRSVWSRYEVLAEVLENRSKRCKAAETLFALSDLLKSLGFRHDRHTSFEQFSRHIRTLVKIGMNQVLDMICVDLCLLQVLSRSDVDSWRSLWRETDGSRCDLVTIERIERNVYESYYRFWCESTQSLIESGVMTLEDQKYLARIVLQNRLEKGEMYGAGERYHHIFVDEFQDINPLDLALLRAIAGLNQTQITIVGDDDQAIYEWRGAAPAFILSPGKYLGVEYQTRILTANYRSPANVVALSQRLIAHNQKRLPKKIQAVNAGNAHIEILSCESVSDAIAQTVQIVLHLLNSGCRVALISRKRSQLIPYQIIFAGRDIPFCAAEDLQIFLSSAFQELKAVIDIRSHAMTKKNYDFDPRSALLTLCDKVERFPLSRKERTELSQYLLSRKPQCIREAWAYLREYHGPLNGCNSDAKKSEFYAEAIRELFKASTVSEVLLAVSRKFKGLQKDYGKAEDDIFYADPPFLYLSELAQMYGSDFARFYLDIEKATETLRSINDLENDADGSTSELWGRSLHLMTALRAKGKEFDAVFILDANQGIWPSKLAETESELEQERRLFYVAMTRARKYLYFVVDNKFIDKPAVPTQYLTEMGLMS